MANATAKKIVEDGWRNAVVTLTGVLDTSNATLSPAVQLSDFTNNDPVSGILKGFRIDHIWHSIADQLEVQLYWNATTPQIIMSIAGRGKESFFPEGGLQPDRTAAGFDGAINLATTGWASGTQVYTIHLVMVKLYG